VVEELDQRVSAQLQVLQIPAEAEAQVDTIRQVTVDLQLAVQESLY
jgi:hypothetical protein